jgi:predicted nucleic acid-binding protein
VSPVLVDSNVILDVATEDAVWSAWSSATLAHAAEHAVLVINPIIYAEVSVGYARIEDLEAALPSALFRRDWLPWEAAFLAGKAFLAYRKRGGQRRSRPRGARSGEDRQSFGRGQGRRNRAARPGRAAEISS